MIGNLRNMLFSVFRKSISLIASKIMLERINFRKSETQYLIRSVNTLQEKNTNNARNILFPDPRSFLRMCQIKIKN